MKANSKINQNNTLIEVNENDEIYIEIKKSIVSLILIKLVGKIRGMVQWSNP